MATLQLNNADDSVVFPPQKQLAAGRPTECQLRLAKKKWNY